MNGHVSVPDFRESPVLSNMLRPAMSTLQRGRFLRLKVMFAAVLLPGLVACSGEPSAGDIDKTVRAYMSESQAQLQRLSGSKNSLGEIHDVKKLGCKSDTDTSYRCDVELDITQLGIRKKGPANFRFVKGSEGWMLAQ